MLDLPRVARIKTGDACILSLEVPPEYRSVYAALIKAGAKRDDRYDATVRPWRKPRSTGRYSQSAHLHGHASQLALAKGVSMATMKQYIKIRASIEMGYPTETIGGVVIPQSEADASVEEDSMLIEMAHIIGAECGMALYEGEGWIN